MNMELHINGETRHIEAAPEALLLDVLRELGFHGVKSGCREGVCGACTVLLDGRAVYACTLLAAQAMHHELTTIEGIGSLDDPHPLQQAFVEAGAVQCGYCTPGMILSAKSLLDQEPAPSREGIARALDGNLCRCTGYKKIFEGVERGAATLRGES